MDLEDFRREYLMGGLRRKDLADDPHAQFERWMQEVIKSDVPDPTAMTLATVSKQGHPRQRIVLLKHFDTQGFVFYTNFDSAKAHDIAANPRVSLHFPWYMMERQVSVLGTAKQLDQASSAEYFKSRPRDSQLAALASKQSREIASREALEAEFQTLKADYEGKEIPAPDFWGGYLVVPEYFEFWQGGANRLHDRFEYKNVGGQWQIARLSP